MAEDGETAFTREPDLTPEQVAAELQVHPQTVRGWLKSGDLEYVSVGARGKRIQRHALDYFKARGGIRPQGRPRKDIEERGTELE